MEKTFITSDLHIGHGKEFLYGPRGFANIWEHDKALVENWNSVVSGEDDVYILGDLMLGDNKYGMSVLNELRGRKHIIWGNHDTDVRKELYAGCRGYVDSQYALLMKYQKHHFYLSHYASLCSNRDLDKPLKARVISLCGHTHTSDPFSDWDKGIIYHCELDAHGMCPVSLDKIIEDIQKRMEGEL